MYTAPEGHVLTLLAHRLTNHEIGDVIGVGVCTAEHHVARIMAKLGIANR